MGMVQTAIFQIAKEMTKKEIIEHNISLTFDFLKEMINKPKILSTIRDRSVIEFVQKDTTISEPKGLRKSKKYIKVKRQFETV